MRIAVPKETAPGERRVALVPESCKKLIQAGYEISVESGAGEAAGFADAAYRELATGELTPPPGAAWARAFVSVGGSSMITNVLALGILQAIYIRRPLRRRSGGR